MKVQCVSGIHTVVLPSHCSHSTLEHQMSGAQYCVYVIHISLSGGYSRTWKVMVACPFQEEAIECLFGENEILQCNKGIIKL